MILSAMAHYKLVITVVNVLEKRLLCSVESGGEKAGLYYHSGEGRIEYLDNNSLSALIERFSSQFTKVMQSALHRDVRAGHRISCVFIDDFPFLSDSDYKRFILMDRRGGGVRISLSDDPLGRAYKIYCDGSFMDVSGKAAYGGFTEDPEGIRMDYSRSFSSGSSNLMELLGVSEGLERLEDIQKIQINTDSRYVIRGLVQWVHFWRHNDWQTAYGRPVKYAEHWQRIDALCADRLIQFNWIKGHSGDGNQDYCHRLAQSSALK